MLQKEIILKAYSKRSLKNTLVIINDSRTERKNLITLLIVCEEVKATVSFYKREFCLTDKGKHIFIENM